MHFCQHLKHFSGSNRCVVIFHCSLIYISLITNNVDCLFTSVCHPNNLSMKCLSVSFARFLIRLFISSWVWRVFFLYISKTPRTITLGVRDFDIQIWGTHKHLVHNAGDDQGPVGPCSFPNGLWNLEPIADSWKDKELVLN